MSKAKLRLLREMHYGSLNDIYTVRLGLQCDFGHAPLKLQPMMANVVVLKKQQILNPDDYHTAVTLTCWSQPDPIRY